MKAIFIELTSQEKEAFNGALNRLSEVLHKQDIKI